MPMSSDKSIYEPLQQIAPMIFIVLSGWLAAELGWVPAISPVLGTNDSLRLGMKSFSNFIFLFALPALLFYELAIFSFRDLEWGFVVAVAIGHTLTWLLTFVGTVWWLLWTQEKSPAKKDDPKNMPSDDPASLMTAEEAEEGKGILTEDPWSRACMNALSTSHPSAIFLGIPLISQLYGEGQVVYCALVSGIGKLTIVLYRFVFSKFGVVISILVFVIVPRYILFFLFLITLFFFQLVRISLKITWKSFLNPITLPIMGGLIWSLTGFHLPFILRTWLQSIGNATVGCALFAVGMSLYFSKNVRADEWTEFMIVIIIKQFVCPLIVIGIAAFLPMEAEVRKVLYILSLLPPSQVIFFIATEYHVGVSVISASILFGGVVAIPNILFSYTLLDLGPTRVFLPRNIIPEDISLLQEIALIIGICSVIGAMWTLLPFIVHFRTTLRSAASQLVSFLALSQMLFVIFQMFGQEGNLPSGTLCTLQGFGIQLFGATSNAYFLIIAVNLFGNCFNPAVSKLGAFLQHPLLVYAYHFICWGYGIVSALILLVLRDYGPAGPWCWISQERSEAEQFYFFYIPLVSFAFIGALLLVYIHYIVSMEKGAFQTQSGVFHRVSPEDDEEDFDGVPRNERRRRRDSSIRVSKKGGGGGEEEEGLLENHMNGTPAEDEPQIVHVNVKEQDEGEGGNAWVRSGLKSKLLWKTRLYILSFIFIWVWGLANRMQQLITDDTLLILFVLHVFCTSAIGIVTFLIWGQTDYHWAFYRRGYHALVWLWKSKEYPLERWGGDKEMIESLPTSGTLGRKRDSDESSESEEESEWDAAMAEGRGEGSETMSVESGRSVREWEEESESDGRSGDDVAYTGSVNVASTELEKVLNLGKAT